jgi:hypothetical protein
MSAALNAAKKRRGVPPSNPPLSQPTQFQQSTQLSPQQSGQSGLTLQQVIQVIDRRLLSLEDFAKKNANMPAVVNTSPTMDTNISDNLTEVLEEYNSRFDILAEEISNLKNIVLNLQSYTMDVNKVLMKERIHILSGDDLPSAEQVDAQTATEIDMANIDVSLMENVEPVNYSFFSN